MTNRVVFKGMIPMKRSLSKNSLILIGIVCGLLLATAFLAGCTSTAPQSQTPPATPAPTPQPAVTTAAPVPTPAAATTGTPKPTFTPSQGNVVAYTAASLSGVSPKLASDFEKMYPGDTVVFNLDGTQALKTQVENGAYADVFISASNSYTNTLKGEGYFVNSTVHPLTSNYVIVILPASNPGNIQSMADLANPGVKIAMEDKSVPAGTATVAVLANLAKDTYNADWNSSVFKNVVTYETSEPAVATKVSLGEVDAGFVYRIHLYGSAQEHLPCNYHPEERQLSPDLHHWCPERIHQHGCICGFREFHAFCLRTAGP